MTKETVVNCWRTSGLIYCTEEEKLKLNSINIDTIKDYSVQLSQEMAK